MGFISWVKKQYFDYRLKTADKKLLDGRLDEAESIYRKLLGKQDMAVVNLAKMYVEHSESVQSYLSALKSIEKLSAYKSESNAADFDNLLQEHLHNMEGLALLRFEHKFYKDAATVLDALRPYYSREKRFIDKLHKYHAYDFFYQSQNRGTNAYLIEKTVDELKAYSPSCISDIKVFLKSLKSRKHYAKAIRLLAPFISIDQAIETETIACVVEVVSGNDAEITKPQSISSFCSNQVLAKKAANELIKLSEKEASARNYKKSVLYDDYAAEYYSDNNAFNNERCLHRLEEFRERANENEIIDLMKMASDLRLNNEQVTHIKSLIAGIAISSPPEKGINICRLFNGDKKFNSVYIEQAANLLRANKAYKIDAAELLKVVQENTDEDTFVDVLSTFAKDMPYYERVFVNAAIAKILRHKSVPMFKKYWAVKEHEAYFSNLISRTSGMSDEVVACIITRHRTFLHNKNFRTAFCKAIDSLGNEEYAIAKAEELLQNQADFNDYYVNAVIKKAGREENNKAIAWINHALSVINDARLLDKKKEIIRQFIRANEFDKAENETLSLKGKDEEYETLFAELCYAKAVISSNQDEKISLLYKVMDLCEQGNVYASFRTREQLTLSELSTLARQCHETQQEEKSYEICERIGKYKSGQYKDAWWRNLYIELRSLDYAKLGALGKRVKFQKETIDKVCSESPASELVAVTEEDYFKLWETYENLLWEKSRSQQKDKAIISFIGLKQQLSQYCSPTYAADKVQRLSQQIVKWEWALAKEQEADQNYAEAIKYYEAIKNEDVKSYCGRAELRSLICSVKTGALDEMTEGRIRDALEMRSYETLKDDLAYRFACYLLKSTRPKDAENILKQYLPNESALLNVCENIYVKESEKYLQAFNEKLKKAEDGTLSVSDASQLLKNLGGYKKIIANKLTDTSNKFSVYKGKLENYIVKALFSEEQYDIAFKKMKSMFPKFIENDTVYRNIAIAALGAIETKQIGKQEAKEAIAVWLSAIYTDRLFVESLDYTAWDDSFTFTLENSLGNTADDDYDDLPENVNFDEPIDNHNISIRTTQDALLVRMENAVRANYPELESFLNGEKNALSKLIDLNLDEDCTIATPYLTTKVPSSRDSIKYALNYEIEQEYGNWENAIELGVSYGLSGEVYEDYSVALAKLEQCKNSMGGTVNQILSAYSDVSKISKYEQLYASFRSFVSNAINDAITSEMNYKTFIDKYEIVCKAVNEMPISLAFANYANGEIVKRLNNDTMTLSTGVGYMVRIYNIAPSSIQVKENLKGMLQNLAIQVEASNNSTDRSVLDKALRDTGNIFNDIVEDAKIQGSLNTIVDKVNNNTMTKSTALKEVYEIYKKCPDNDRVCGNLATLCNMCIYEYVIEEKWGSVNVKRILNALCENRSATFKRHKSTFANSYHQIWNSLSFDNQIALNSGVALNDKGWALKRGLDYYKKLGEVSGFF